jgi:hypothetical protein
MIPYLNPQFAVISRLASKGYSGSLEDFTSEINNFKQSNSKS